MDLLVDLDGVLWVVLLGAGAALLLVLTRLTASRPQAPVPGIETYLDRWRDVHGGYDPRTGSSGVRGWLLIVHRLAGPLARAGVAPDALTLWTLWVAAAVLVAASAGGSWTFLAGWLVLLGGLGDSLDGAVAVLTGRATAWGYVLDSAVDRVSELLFVAALVVVGAPAWLAVVCVAAFWQLEYIRARAGSAGGSAVVVITVAERATRVAVCAAGLLVAGLSPTRAAAAATVAVGVLAVASLVGVGQVLRGVRRQLGRPGGAGSRTADEVGDDRGRQRDQGQPSSGM